MTWRRWFVLGLASAAVTLAAGAAEAQLAPGGHHAARASDTGHAGLVNSSGGYGASVPLDLPPARGDLPLPVQLGYGERGVGAAGLGWDVPLSFIQRDTTFARRRPVNVANAAPQSRGEVSLVLAGRRLDLVRTATHWVARRDAPDLVIREDGDGWVMYDGQGRTFRFAAVSALAGTGLWLLQEIRGPAGSQVMLDHSVTTPTLPGGPVVTIDVAGLRYNPHPTTANCYKHEVSLRYDGDAATPLSLSVLGDKVLARRHKLTSIDVSARESCASGSVRLRRYQLTYAADPDTGLPRLREVTLLGREGTPEASTPLPVSKYEYGTATAEGKLTYESLGGSMGLNLGRTTTIPPSRPGFVSDSSTTDLFADLTGDGRPDLVTFTGAGSLTMARSTAGSGVSFEPHQGLADSGLPPRALELRATRAVSFVNPDGGVAPSSVVNQDVTWRQVIDVNGDGRIDLVDAREQAGRWVVYLNTPDPVDPRRVVWQRRSLAIGALTQQLRSRGLGVNGDFLPLGRRASMLDHRIHLSCWIFNGFEWLLDEIGFAPGGCQVPAAVPSRTATITEWELRDINGDGYPDVVFNSSPAERLVRVVDERIPEPPMFTTKVARFIQDGFLGFRAGPPNKLEAMINVLGTQVSVDSPAFSSPVTLVAGASCGLAQSEMVNGVQLSHCGLFDVNGDGVADYVDGVAVLLGTGNLVSGQFFVSGTMLSLPGRLTTHQQSVTTCNNGAVTSQLTQTAGLRDLTGDGIPDYAARGPGSNWRVSIGTGTGFTAPVGVQGVTFQLSAESSECSVAQRVTTTSGVFDVNGDGKADVVTGGSVFGLLGSSGVVGSPDAGRLIQTDNGHGALTTIRYRSAKQEDGTLHQVPFAEIVVDSVQTAGMQGFGGSLAATRYAYGGAELVFDQASDAFRLLGYRRQIVVPPAIGQPSGVATITITDAYAQVVAVDPLGLQGEDTLSAAQRYALQARIGRVSDVTVLSGNFGAAALAAPSQLLGINIHTDVRRIGGVHHEWDARLLVAASDRAGPEPCAELVFPYDVAASATYLASLPRHDPCTARGFAFGASVQSWRGNPGAAPPSTANVERRSEVRAVDDLGRVLTAAHLNDVHRAEDDVCIVTAYATPTGDNDRQVHAAASRKVTNCAEGAAAVTFAGGLWEYDQLPAGSVSAGFPTAYTVERRDDTGALLGTIRQFDATYDEAGNPRTVTTVREDGAARTVTVDYDPFKLAQTGTTTQATGVPALQSNVTLDPLTLNVLSVTDATGAQSGATFDGFDRVVLTTVTPVGGAGGVMSIASYLGFAGGDPLGRRIVQKVFAEAVTPVNTETASAAAGRMGTLYLDELGRERRTELALGADYANQRLIIGHRVYDGSGRAVFEADPYPSTQGFATAYGTTAFFHADGTLHCTVRARGQRQTVATATDEAQEVYPTCLSRTYEDNAEVVSVRTADALLAGSPQAGVVRTSFTTAIGRPLARSTSQNGTRLEHATFTHDQLGRMTSMARYHDPQGRARPVTSSWRHDSLGQILELLEPEAVPQVNSYSNWGELVAVARHAEGVELGVHKSYDALGRLLHSEERRDGVVAPETMHDYFYDQGVSIAPQVSPTNVLGRLALAVSPTGSVSLSYDGLGRVNARVFTSDEGGLYVEKHESQTDGTPKALELYLPDTGFDRERVEYAYDSAGRGASVLYIRGDSDEVQSLFEASSIDPFGRVRQAQYGATQLDADYTDVGRRLLNQIRLSSPQGTRSITFQGHDPVGRERSRLEARGGQSTTTSYTYDALGRLSTALQTRGATTVYDQQFAYDPLGNVVSRSSVGAGTTTFSYSTVDRDRICRISYQADGSTACNVTYDEVGSIVAQATPTGQREYSYLLDGRVRTVTDDQGSTAHYRYDAFGGVQQLDLMTGLASLTRRDRNYGALLSEQELSAGSGTVVLSRKIPGPSGLVATRRGPSGPWLFAFGEARGTRFVTDEAGEFVQDIDYEPYGKPSSTGAPVGGLRHTNEQWNGGDTLAAFGISQLGARLYDPAIGRFVSRDPLLIPRSASTTNPYAFAMNDPVNYSDWSGMDPSCKPGPDAGTCVEEKGNSKAPTSSPTSEPSGSLGGLGGWRPLSPLDFASPGPSPRVDVISTDPCPGCHGSRNDSHHAVPGASVGGSGGITAIYPLPWSPPGNQWGGFYVGNQAHELIAAYYRGFHGGDKIYSNSITLSTILGEQGLDRGRRGRGFGRLNLRLRPDIVNISLMHAYEIKPATLAHLGLMKLAVYLRTFRLAGLNIVAGPSSEPGTRGVLPAPGGAFTFWSPAPGLIVYRYWATPRRMPDRPPRELPVFEPLEISVPEPIKAAAVAVVAAMAIIAATAASLVFNS